jgi:dTDP-glucose 4,6-dehydratase
MYPKNQVLTRLNNYKKILVTGGSGFIGSTLIRRLILETDSHIFNLDKMGYASDDTSIKNIIKECAIKPNYRYSLLELDLKNEVETERAIENVQPDLIFHLAAESHVDRSINGPKIFIESNVLGTYNLLQACTKYYLNASTEKKNLFRFHHISTDEVYGSLGDNGKFSELSQYSPNSPYSASKAASDHFVNAWNKTYKLPTLTTNCSNNYGPWQYPEKLIPLAINNALHGKPITLYGKGLNIRDWLFVEDHVDALLTVAMIGEIGSKYCIGGKTLLTNKKLLELLCCELDKRMPKTYKYSKLITHVEDRKGHDYRYAINARKIKDNLGWEPDHSFSEGLTKTVEWYINNIKWCEKIIKKNKLK